MYLIENFSYYLIVIPLTFLISFFIAIKIIFSKPGFTLHLNILKDNEEKILWLAIIIYFFIFSFFSILKYNAYNMAMLDLGRMDQAIWNTSQGRLFACTFESGNICRLIEHSEFIFVLIAPFYLLYSDPKVILIIQTLVISLGALPIYWLARKRLSSSFAPLCFSLAYLLYPSLQYGNLADFHPDMLATTFFLFTFYYLDCENWFKYFVFLLLSLLCKEYASLIVVMLGIYIFIAKRNNKFASITFFLGISWFLMTYKVIPKYLNVNTKEILGIQYYAGFGQSIEEVFKSIVFHPVKTILHFVTFKKLTNLVLLFLPVGFLPLFNLPILLIILPVFIGVILTPFFSYANHHNGMLIPFIFISSIGAGQYLINKFNLKFKNITYAVGIFVFSSSLLSNIFYGPSPLSWRFWNKASYRYWNNLHQFRVTEHDRIADKIIKMIPQEARVSASNHLASHLSQRETIYHFPQPKNFNNIDFIMVDLLEYFAYEWIPRNEEVRFLRDLLSGEDFSLAFYEDGILLLQRGLKKEKGYYLKAAKVKGAFPQYSLNVSFNERLLLIGYDLKNEYLEVGKKQRIVYYWQVLKDFDKKFSHSTFSFVENLNREYILIDTFENKGKKIRLVHLPTYILYPPENWKAGDIIKEGFDFYIPESIIPDSYAWKLGLYAVSNYFFIQTDTQNLVPGTQEIKLKGIKIENR